MSNQPQQTAARSLWDRLLFAQILEFTVDLPPEDCLDRLMGLEQPMRGVFNPSSITTRRIKTNNHLYEFRVYANRYGRGMHYGTAQFACAIDINDSGQTEIKGDFRVGAIALIIVVGLIPLFIASLGDFRAWAFPWIVAVVGLSCAWQIRSDYRKLRSLIDEAITKQVDQSSSSHA